MAPPSFLLYTLLTFFLSFHGITAVEYAVINDAATTPGGTRFNNEIGVCKAKQIMATANSFILYAIFQQSYPSDQKAIDLVNLYIEEVKFPLTVTWGNNNINFSSIYMAGFKGDLKREFMANVYHEMTHVLQWTGNGNAPPGLIEGMAEYTKLKANLTQPGFAEPGQGDHWHQGYDVTARFLEYCEGITPGFVAKLNKMMRFRFEFKYFKDLTGKPVYQLWLDYKVKYGQCCN
ncbi:uncharacterized protein LOC112500548 [Cynara cardunculus var. scolymus]|uniref:uncharacterized protein LOC112500548 n=1 Tax=Cynara cardunculus var. scolymus TaxID=59895 RepID=UPI000D630144|nr:uncharacterized protein LOC112500548 [Cynara cardunculus var. scolymus]